MLEKFRSISFNGMLIIIIGLLIFLDILFNLGMIPSYLTVPILMFVILLHEGFSKMNILKAIAAVIFLWVFDYIIDQW